MALLKHWLKLALRPEYRALCAPFRSAFRGHAGELARLLHTPRYAATWSDRLGKRLELVDGYSFLGAYAEIFERGVYRFRAATDAPRILDVGANVGLATLDFKRQHPKARVTAFEADPAIAETLRRNCRAFGHEDVEVVAKAAWNAETTLKFAPEGGEAGRVLDVEGRASRARGPEAREAAEGGPFHVRERSIVEVPACRLRDWLAGPVDLLKLDVEGAETEILRDCADRLADVRHLFIESHSFAAEPQTLPELLSIAQKAGFRLNVEHLVRSPRPFVERTVNAGMDCQLNIFAFRE